MQIGGAVWIDVFQKPLAKHGYYRGAIDRSYGPNTRVALEVCLNAGCRFLE